MDVTSKPSAKADAPIQGKFSIIEDDGKVLVVEVFQANHPIKRAQVM